jgi:hypothetical protein
MSTPLQPTPYSRVKSMTGAWKNGLCELSTVLLQQKYPDRPGIEEAQAGWISRADLNALLDDNAANGLRIYYGTHDESTLPGSAPYEFLGLHNVILVATVDSADPDNPTYQNSVDQLDQTKTAADGTFKGMGGDLIPLCPPACPPGN